MKNRTIVNLSTLSVWRRVADPPSSRGKAGKDLSSTEIPASENTHCEIIQQGARNSPEVDRTRVIATLECDNYVICILRSLWIATDPHIEARHPASESLSQVVFLCSANWGTKRRASVW